MTKMTKRQRRPAAAAKPRPEGPSVLSAWRRLGPDEMTGTTLRDLRAALNGSLSLYDRSWPAAAKGNPDAAVAIAIDQFRGGEPRGAAGDLAMSAVLLLAAEGHPAATLVLSHGLATMSRRAGQASRLFTLARLWSAPGRNAPR